MMEKISQILQSAPIDMSDILRLERTAVSNDNTALLAGSANAHLLALLDGIGLGRQLSGTEVPCVIICEKGDALRIMLETETETVRASSMDDLAQRLTWPENRGATVRITVPGDLFGRDRLIFAVLDENNYRAQLNTHALGSACALIVIDAMDAPSMEAYQFAEWLNEACGLADATGVLVAGGTDMPNTAPSIVMAVKMGRQTLPVTTLNTFTESAAEKLRAALSGLSAGDRAMENIYREMVRCALDRLDAEKKRVREATVIAPGKKLSLAERFEAQVPGTRVKVGALITAHQADRLNSDVRDFSIFLQHHLEELLVSSLPLLDKPKEALQAFSQGYLSDILSDYCSDLINDMCRTEIAPKLEEFYKELFDLSWIRMAVESGELPESALDTFDVAVRRKGFFGEALIESFLNSLIMRILRNITLQARLLTAVINNLIIPLIHTVQFRLTSPEKYARNKADQLSKVLDSATARYQELIRDSMLPQIESEILYWFDDHVKQVLEILRAKDAENAAARENLLQLQMSAGETIEKIEKTEAALRECLQAAD